MVWNCQVLSLAVTQTRAYGRPKTSRARRMPTAEGARRRVNVLDQGLICAKMTLALAWRSLETVSPVKVEYDFPHGSHGCVRSSLICAEVENLTG